MDWCLEGAEVTAVYHSTQIRGTVEYSRTTAGVGVKHYVTLAHDTDAGNRIRRKGDVVVIPHEQVLNVNL